MQARLTIESEEDFQAWLAGLGSAGAAGVDG
jgi:hypothetical protein